MVSNLIALAAMRKWLTILLLTCLPLQLSWAAVSSYCEHEMGIASEHFGHHEHQHNGALPQSLDQTTLADGMVVDSDCASCHASLNVAMPASPQMRLSALTNLRLLETHQRPSSVLALRPERPKWTCVAY